MEKIEDLIYNETEKRLKLMESKNYQFPKRLGKLDIIIILFLIVTNLLLIVFCMIGVID